MICGMVLCIQPPVLFPHPSDGEDHHPEPDHSSNSTGGHSLGDIFTGRRLELRTEGNEDYYLGVLLALGTALTGSMANVSIAKCERVSSKVMVFYSGLGGVFIALICIMFDPESRTTFIILLTEQTTWPLLLLLGLMGILGYFSLTRSLRLIPPTTVAVLRAMEIILAYIVQVCSNCNRYISNQFPTQLIRPDENLKFKTEF